MRHGSSPKGPAIFPRFVVIGALSVLATTLALSLLFEHSGREILAERAIEELGATATMFERIHQASYPAFFLLDKDPDVAVYLGRDGIGKNEVLYALESIDKVVASNDLVHSIYLYRAGSGVLSTRRGWEPLTEESDSSFPALLSSIGPESIGKYLPRRLRFSGDLAPTKVLTLVFGVVPGDGSGMRKALVVNLKADRLWGLLSARSQTNPQGGISELAVLSSDLSILWAARTENFGRPASSDPRLVPVTQGQGSQGRAVVSTGGENWLVVWLGGPPPLWRFVLLSREDLLFGRLKATRDAIVLIAILAIGIVVGLTILVSRDLGRKMKRESLMAAWLSGRMDFEEASHNLDSGLLPGHGPWQAATLRLGGLRALELRNGPLAAQEARDWALATVRSSGPFLHVAWTESKDLFLLASGSGPQGREGLLASLAGAKAALEARFPRLAILVWPRDLEHPEALPEAYRALAGGCAAAFRRGFGQIRDLDPGADAPGEDIYHDEGLLASFESALTRGEAGEALSLATAILDSAVSAQVSEASFRFLVSTLAHRGIRALQKDADFLLEGGNAGFRRAASAIDTPEEALALLEQACRAAGNRAELSVGQRRRDVCRQVKTLVAQRLADPALGTAAISDAVGLSPHYLRELFRQIEGEPLLQYLGGVRVAEAKRLLASTGLPVRDICVKTGFINYSYFLTYFKKLTGFTPSAWRESCQSPEKTSAKTD